MFVVAVVVVVVVEVVGVVVEVVGVEVVGGVVVVVVGVVVLEVTVVVDDAAFAEAFFAFCCAFTALGFTDVVGGGADASMPPFSKHSRQAFISNGYTSATRYISTTIRQNTEKVFFYKKITEIKNKKT